MAYAMACNLACQWGKNSWQFAWAAGQVKQCIQCHGINCEMFKKNLTRYHDLPRQNGHATFVNSSWTMSKLDATTEWKGMPMHMHAMTWTLWNSRHGLAHQIACHEVKCLPCIRCRRRFWHATHDCVATYVDIILHRGRFWAKSAASGSIWWCCFRSCWTVLSHVMRGRPGCLLQSAGGDANRILLASALSSMNRVSRCYWIIAVNLGCFVSLCTSSFRTNLYHLMPSSICRHHWLSASILRASVLEIAQQSEPYKNIGKMHVLYSFNFVEMASRDLQIWFSKLCIRQVNISHLDFVKLKWHDLASSLWGTAGIKFVPVSGLLKTILCKMMHHMVKTTYVKKYSNYRIKA